MNREPIVSIITVVYNNAKNLEKTINSVRNLSYPNIEFIIIDGGSTDDSISIINKNKDIISKSISEKDKGIYDAMNKGLRLSEGDYVWFLNGGDEPYSADILNRIFEINNEADFYYGDTEMIDDEGSSFGKRTLKTPPENLNWTDMINGMVISHQSIIVRKFLCEDYNINYKYVADIDWTIRVLKKCRSIINTKLIISKFLIGGFSRKNTIRSIIERYKMLTVYFNPVKVFFNHFKITYMFIVYIIKKRKLL